MAIGLGRKRPTKREWMATTDGIVKLCAEADCSFLVQPLSEAGLTLDQAKEVLTEAQGVRDRVAAGLPHDPQSARQIADRFITGAFATGSLSSAVGALITDITASMDGEEIDHHPPSQPAQGGFNPVSTYS